MLRCILPLICATLVALPARAEQVVVVPLGEGDALVTAAKIAHTMVKKMNKRKRGRATLGYPPGPFPELKRGLLRKAGRLLKAARRAYLMMQYDKVGKLAARARQLYKTILKSDKGRDDFVESLHLVAASELLAGNSKEAAKLMHDAILLDPRPPAKKIFSPQVQDLYQRVKVEPPPRGSVKISSMPGALVWFNGRLWGPAHGTARLRAGLYLIRVWRPGYKPSQRWFRVKPNKERAFPEVLAADEEQPTPELVQQLRDELRAEVPGTGINQMALDHGVEQVMLVAAAPRCGEAKKCRIRMCWAGGGKWRRRRVAVYKGKEEPVALAMLRRKRRKRRKPRSKPRSAMTPNGISPILAPGQRCTMDSQCGMNEKCEDGACVKPSSIARKWWFWTIIGAVAAGATVGIVVPLTRPEGPVIEVR